MGSVKSMPDLVGSSTISRTWSRIFLLISDWLSISLSHFFISELSPFRPHFSVVCITSKRMTNVASSGTSFALFCLLHDDSRMAARSAIMNAIFFISLFFI